MSIYLKYITSQLTPFFDNLRRKMKDENFKIYGDVYFGTGERYAENCYFNKTIYSSCMFEDKHGIHHFQLKINICAKLPDDLDRNILQYENLILEGYENLNIKVIEGICLFDQGNNM